MSTSLSPKKFLFCFSLRTGTIVTNVLAVFSGCFGIYMDKTMLYCSTAYLIIALILAWICDDGVKFVNSLVMLPMMAFLIVNYVFCIVLLVFEIMYYVRVLSITLLVLWLIFWWYGSYIMVLCYKQVKQNEQAEKLRIEQEC